jgi:hypothetical protein
VSGSLLSEIKLIDEKIQLFTSFALLHDAGVKKGNNNEDIGNKGEIMNVVASRASVPSFGREVIPELELCPFDHDLWTRLETMEIDPPDATTRFQHRLKQYNKWTDEFTARVTKEYRRFLYLAARAGHPVTPSDTVDQAWHLHLIYTRHYWQELCGKILGLELHHDPSAGGTVESNKFERQYEQTIESYKAAFGGAPPADIWPVREPAKPGAFGKKFLVAGGTVVGTAIVLKAANASLLTILVAIVISVAIVAIIACSHVATAAPNPGKRGSGCGAAGSGGHAAAAGSCGSGGHGGGGGCGSAGGAGCGGGGCGGGGCGGG